MNVIRKWHLKALVQKTISLLPWSNQINLLFQKYVTGGVILDDEHFGYKIGHAGDHLEAAFSYFPEERILDRNFNVLELGSGWYPVVPIAMRLAGVPRITTIDLSRHLSINGFVEASRKIIEWYGKGELKDLFKIRDEGVFNLVRSLAEDNSEIIGGGRRRFA